MIREGKYRSAVEELRGVFPILKWTRKENGTVDGIGEVVKNLQRVSLVSELRKREGQTERGAYNGLVLVEVEGLKDYGTACGVRDMVKDLPQTFMAFVGPSGRSVKIVCRVEPLAGKKLEAMDLEKFHANAYRMACQFYEAQLNMSIGYVIPHLDRLCYMSADDGMVYQPEAIPFYTDDRDSDWRPLTGSKGVKEDVSLIPGRDHFQSLRIIYQYCLRDAMGLSLEAPDEDEQVAILNKLAFHCMESGIPMAMAVRYTLYNPTLGNDELLVKTVFENIYLQKQGEDYYRRRGKVCPLKHVPESTLLMMQTDIFLHENYEMRMNVMTGVPQFRELDKYTYDFRDISPEDQNTMTIRALQSGLKSWDKDIARYINSSLIPKYDPGMIIWIIFPNGMGKSVLLLWRDGFLPIIKTGRNCSISGCVPWWHSGWDAILSTVMPLCLCWLVIRVVESLLSVVSSFLLNFVTIIMIVSISRTRMTSMRHWLRLHLSISMSLTN